MPNQSVIVLDFGGQYNQLIARRVRECNVYCEVKPHTMSVDEIRAFDPIGIIFTGGPQSVYAEGSPQVDPEIFRLGIPILGICYGCQLMAQYLGGEVTAAGKDTAREYGKTQTWFDTDCRLFRGLPEQSITWMSHGDYMAKVPESFRLVAHSAACPTVGICDEARGFYGVQFHPEVNHTEYGRAMLRNFLYEVCGATGEWTMGDFMRKSIADIRAKVGGGKVLLALSGGVDSSVAAALLAEAVGNQLTCIFVDHGLLRKNEGDEVEAAFQNWDINFVRVNAEERFLTRLKDVSDPETKRKIIGESPPSSRATTTSAACRTLWISRRSLSRCACCSRMRFAHSAANSACRSIWSCASRSRARVWPSAASARCPRISWTSCATRTSSSAMRSPRRTWSRR